MADDTEHATPTLEPSGLLGAQLGNGWVLEEHRPRSATTGGQFSTGYCARDNEGRKVFVKILDIRQALASDDVSAALKPLIEAFEFERELLDECADLPRIVTAIESGQLRIAGLPVQYLIFELADGDARQQRQILHRFDGAWALRTLHGVAAALEQLHQRGIAHQDIKPSNVLIFAHGDTRVADLGRSCHRHRHGPNDKDLFPGDMRYAPPEYLYDYMPPDWAVRRYSADMYLLGSLVSFLLTGASMSDRTVSHLDHPLLPGYWSDPYHALIPHLRDAQARVIADLHRELDGYVAPSVCSNLLTAVERLCHPDPYKRGHPRAHAQATPFDLRRFVSLFDLLAQRQEHYVRATANS